MSSNLIEGTNLYIILGAGRTGSNYLRDKLSNPMDARDGPLYNRPAGLCYAVGTSEDNIDGLKRARDVCPNIVMHTHNKNIIADLGLLPQDVTLIISKRRNGFETCMSHITAHITGEWHHYTNKPRMPVTVSVDRFLKLANNVLTWYDDIDMSLPYKKVYTIYYEDVVSGGLQYLRDVMGLQYSPSCLPEYEFASCPHRYEEWVLNWKELQDQYSKIADVAQ